MEFLCSFLRGETSGGGARKRAQFSSNVFGWCTSSRSELFAFSICPDAPKYVLLSVFTLIETICPNVFSKSELKSAKSPLPVDVRRTRTGNLSKDVLERRTSTGSEALPLFICLDSKKICIANCLFSYNDDLSQSLNQSTVQ